MSVPHLQLPTEWVAAAPFRCHVQSLLTTTHVPWQLVAVLAELPLAQVRALLFGRGGRRRPRLSPYAARRLYALTPDQILAVRNRTVAGETVQETVCLLLDEGLSVTDVARSAALDEFSVVRLAAGRGVCSQVDEIMLQLACVEHGLVVEPEARFAA